MKINEIINEEDTTDGYWSGANDKIETRGEHDVRKIHLTLKHLNRLRKLREIKKLDLLKSKSLLEPQYGAPAGGAGGGLGF